MQPQSAASVLRVIAWLSTALIPLFLIFSRGAADGALTLTALLFLLHSALRKDWGWVRAPFFLVALALWAWVVLAVTPLAIAPLDSLQRAATWIRYPIFFMAVTGWVLREEKARRWFFIAQAALLVFVTVDALWQYITGMSLTGNAIIRERLTGPFDNVKVGIFLAKTALPLFGLFFLVALLQRGSWKKRAMSLLAVAGLLALFSVTTLLSGERTAFLTLLLGLMAAGAVVVLRMPRARLPILLAALVATAVIMSLYVTQINVYDRTHYLIKNLMHFEETEYGQLFTGAWEVWKTYPVSGAGLRGFREACFDVIYAGIIEKCNLHPHNPYLEWLAEAGVVGLLMFCALVGALFMQAARALRQGSGAGAIPAAFALGVVVLNFFPLMASQSMFSNWPGVLMWYSLAIGFSPLTLEKRIA